MEINERIAKLEESTKQCHKRIDENDSKIENLEKTYIVMEKMNYRIENMEQNVNQINKKIDENTKQKGMKWDKLIDYLFYVIVSYALFKLGLK